jgi:hypothetical protein
LGNTVISQNNLQLGKDKDDNNSNVGPEKPRDPNDNQIEIETRSQDIQNDFPLMPPQVVS